MKKPSGVTELQNTVSVWYVMDTHVQHYTVGRHGAFQNHKSNNFMALQSGLFVTCGIALSYDKVHCSCALTHW